METVYSTDWYVACAKCGRQHEKTTQNCLWISCDCGTTICGTCGSDKIEYPFDDDSEDSMYACGRMCGRCNSSCSMCV